MAEVPPSIPGLADCLTTLQSPNGTVSQPSPSTLLRSLDGKLRVDLGQTSVITNPVDRVVILLDHVKLEARTLPMDKTPGPPALPNRPNIPALPSAGGGGNIEDLGKSMIQGILAEGKRYTIPAPGTATAPTIAEVWTCTATQLPVMSKITGAFGVRTSICKTAPVANPAPSSFQVPAGYKQLP